MRYDRREFLRATGVTSLGTLVVRDAPVWAGEADGSSVEAALSLSPRPLRRTYRAAAIGSTGRGGFGHGLDRVFVALPGVDFVALADDNEQGRVDAGKRNHVERLYGDYRQMLAKEKLDVVSIGTRHSALHEEMVIDCARAGVHIYCEKPLATDLASTDRMLAAVQEHGVKLAVALPNRVAPPIRQVLAMLEEGQLGTLLSLRARGKEDRRGGGEDLLVLGYHLFDLMCLFGGRPQWTFAHVRQEGREMVAEDGRPASEQVGQVAGDWLAAMYGFPSGAHGYFESHRGLEGGSDRFSLEIHGTQGVIATRSLGTPMWFRGPIFNPARPHTWEPISTPAWDAVGDKGHWCGQRIVRDLLLAAEEDRAAISSGDDARWVQEMIQSVYVSQLARARVALPLKHRDHPLGDS